MSPESASKQVQLLRVRPLPIEFWRYPCSVAMLSRGLCLVFSLKECRKRGRSASQPAAFDALLRKLIESTWSLAPKPVNALQTLNIYPKDYPSYPTAQMYGWIADSNHPELEIQNLDYRSQKMLQTFRFRRNVVQNSQQKLLGRQFET